MPGPVIVAQLDQCIAEFCGKGGGESAITCGDHGLITLPDQARGFRMVAGQPLELALGDGNRNELISIPKLLEDASHDSVTFARLFKASLQRPQRGHASVCTQAPPPLRAADLRLQDADGLFSGHRTKYQRDTSC